MVIDSLDVEIQAQAKSVDSALDNVVETLDRIIGKINIIGKNSGLENFAKNVTQQMSSVKSVADKITKSIEPQVQKTSKLLEGLGKDFNIKGKIDSSQFKSLKMGSEEVEASVRSMAEKFSSMGLTVENALQKQVNSFAKANFVYAEQVRKVEELRSSLLELSNTKIETPEFKQATKDIQTAEKNLGKYIEKQGKLIAESGLPASMVYEVYAKEIKELSDALDVAKEKQRELIKSGGAYTVPDLSGISSKFENESRKLGLISKELQTSFDGITKKMQTLDSQSFAQNLKNINVAFSGVEKGLKKVDSAINKVLSHIGKLIKSIFTLNNGINKSNAGFNLGFKTLLKYGFGIRSLYVLFNRLRSAIKEGMKNLVQYSGETNASISLLSNSLNQLKNASAAMAAPLLNAFAPALNQIIQLCIKAVNAINQLFSALTGKGTWIKVTALTDDYAKSLGGVSKAMKTVTLGIDEFNINAPDEGAGGGAGEILPEDMFEEVKIPDWMLNLSDWLKGMWADADFYDLGKLLGEKLKDALDSIPWNKIKESARKIAKMIATLINGFIEVEDLGYSIGRTLAEALNTAFEFLNAFVHELHWESVGKFISETINGFFQNIDWSLIRDTLITGAKGLSDTINSFTNYLDWGAVADSISNSINIISDTVIEFFEKTRWDELGRKMGYTLERTIESIDFVHVGRAIADVIQSGLDFVSGIISELDWSKIKSAFKDLLTGFFDNIKIPSNLKGIIKTILGIKVAIVALNGVIKTAKIAKAFIDISDALKEIHKIKAPEIFNVVSKSFEQFKNSFDVSGDLFGSFKNGLSALDNGIATLRNNLTGLQKGAITAVAGFAEFKIISSTFENLASGSENVIASIAKIGSSAGIAAAAMYTAFGPAGAVAAAITGVVAAIKGINDSISHLQLNAMFESVKNNGVVSLEALGNVAKDAFGKVTQGTEETIEKLNSISQTKESIDGTVENINSIKTAIENGAYGVSEKVPEIIEQFETLLSNSKTVLEEEYDVIIKNVVGAWADVLTAQGKSIPEVVAGLLDFKNQGNEAYTALETDLQNLITAYEDGAISAEEFYSDSAPLFEKIATLNLDESVQSITEFGEALNLSKYIKEDGFKVDDFKNDIGDVAQAAEDGKNNLQLLAEENIKNLSNYQTDLETLGVDISGFDWASLYGASDTQVADGIDAIDSAYQDYANQVQYGLLELLPGVIEDATKEYEELEWWQKLFTTKEGYIQGKIDEFEKNILDPATSSIESGFEDLGIDGEVWASEAAEKLINSLFDTVTTTSYEGVELTTTTLKDDWENILTNALDGAAEAIDAESYGKNIVDGLDDGIDANKQSSYDKINEWMNGIDSAVHDSALKFGSPSIKMSEYGENTVAGYVRGVEQNKQTALDTISAFATSLVEIFDNIMPDDAWSASFDGMLESFKAKWEELSLWWSEEAIPSWMEESVIPSFSEETWFEATDGMKIGIMKKWEEFTKLWKDNFTKWWNMDISPWFTVEKWMQFGENMKEGLYTGFKGIVLQVGAVMNGMVDVFNQGLDNIANAFNDLISQFNAIAGTLGVSNLPYVSPRNISKVGIPAFATGAIVYRPTFGVIGEAGKEGIVPLTSRTDMQQLASEITNYGLEHSYNGNGIFGESWIEEAIRKGMRDVAAEILVPYLSDIVKNTRETADKDMSFNVDGREFVSAVESANESMGYNFSTGQSRSLGLVF